MPNWHVGQSLYKDRLRMSSWVDWNIDDEYGDNPTGKPGAFEFRIGYYIEPGEPMVLYTPNGDGHPGYPPTVILEGVDCVRVQFDNEPSRAPTKDEDVALSDWCQQYLEARPSELAELENRAFEYSYIEPDYDDKDD